MQIMMLLYFLWKPFLLLLLFFVEWCKWCPVLKFFIVLKGEYFVNLFCVDWSKGFFTYLYPWPPKPFSSILSHIFPDSPVTLQMIPPLLALSQNRSKLKLYIAHLTDLCHDRDPSILSQLTPPSHYHRSDPEDWEDELQKMTVQQVADNL